MLLRFHSCTCSLVLTGIPTLHWTEQMTVSSIPPPLSHCAAATHAGKAVDQIPVLDAERECAVAALREAVRGEQRHAELLQRLLEHPVRGGGGPLGVPRGPAIQLRYLTADQQGCGRGKSDGVRKQQWTPAGKAINSLGRDIVAIKQYHNTGKIKADRSGDTNIPKFILSSGWHNLFGNNGHIYRWSLVSKLRRQTDS